MAFAGGKSRWIASGAGAGLGRTLAAGAETAGEQTHRRTHLAAAGGCSPSAAAAGTDYTSVGDGLEEREKEW